MQLGQSRPPLICVAGFGGDEEVWLKQFDDPPPSLLGVVEEAREQLGNFSPGTLVPKVDFDEAGKWWAEESGIGAITTSPIIFVEEGQAVEAFNLFLVMPSELNDAEIAVLNSLCRRIALTLQNMLCQAQRDGLISGKTKPC